LGSRAGEKNHPVGTPSRIRTTKRRGFAVLGAEGKEKWTPKKKKERAGGLRGHWNRGGGRQANGVIGCSRKKKKRVTPRKKHYVTRSKESGSSVKMILTNEGENSWKGWGAPSSSKKGGNFRRRGRTGIKIRRGKNREGCRHKGFLCT